MKPVVNEAMTRQTGSGENRRTSRLSGAFPLRVRGVDAAGKAFDSTSLADNICAGGLYFQIPRPLARNASLLAVIRVTGRLAIVAQGHVLREESRHHGLSGMAVQFTRTRLLQVREAS